MRSPALQRRWGCWALLWALVWLVPAGTIGLTAQPAAAASSGPSLSMKLVDFPTWMGPATDVSATVDVTNNGTAPVSNLSIHLDGYRPPGSRSELSNQLAGKGLTSAWADSESFPDTLDPGQTKRFVLDLQTTLTTYSYFRQRASGQADRAYPVRLTVDVGNVPTVYLSTELIYFQETAEQYPLQVGLVIPLDAPAAFNPSDQETSRSLEQAIAPGGRIGRILAALQSPEFANVNVALAPTGEFLGGLAILSSGNGFPRVTRSGIQQVAGDDPVVQQAAATIQTLLHLATQPNIRIINTPYSQAPLPALMANGFTSAVADQIRDGASTLKAVLPGVNPLPGWLLPTDGLLDDATLAEVAGLGITDVILAPPSLASSSVVPLTPSAQITAVAPKNHASVGALVEDSTLASRLAPGDGGNGLDPVQIRQQFLAEAATIEQEQPAVSRAVVTVAPNDWSPDPTVLDGVLSALTSGSGAPWMAGATPDALAATGTAPAIDVADSVVSAGPSDPGKDYFDALRTAGKRLSDFEAIGPPARLVNDLTRRLLVAEGEEWWGRGSTPDKGRPFATYVTNRVKAELAKIQINRNSTVTITSQKAKIPFAVESGLGYPVTVMFYLASDRLTFTQGSACPGQKPGQATCLMQTLKPRAQIIVVHASAKFSGQFPVQIEVRTPANVLITRGSLLVRSTAYNIVALVIMGAAALFLLIAWARGVVRRRVRSEVHPEAAPAAGETPGVLPLIAPGAPSAPPATP
ncbi:MAG TPA: DUF6049 family protein [Actinomycetota bacterium]|nr:DUF6049 family protein [Actinomycetota bacterium]